MTYSVAYREWLKAGPFPGQIDPWAEDARYFQSIHSGMIEHLLGQIQDPLLDKGYLVGKETSLQIAEGRIPDLNIRRETGGLPSHWDYSAAALAASAEPGVVVEESDLQALWIQDVQSGTLVTVVEIVSPSNKAAAPLIQDYEERRGRLLVQQGVNIVEIDLTRSVKRLYTHYLTANYPYHVLVHLPAESAHVIPLKFGEPLKRIAIPLRGEVIGVELQAAYEESYRRAAIAAHMRYENHYVESKLPSPTLLTTEQHTTALQALTDWTKRLNELETETRD
jgi:hypothetical protein